jgi:hypothetical protein
MSSAPSNEVDEKVLGARSQSDIFP